MDEYLLEKLESPPQWSSDRWCAQHAWLLNKLTWRTQTLVIAQLYAHRAISSDTTHERLLEVASAILSGDLLDGRRSGWPQHPDNYLEALHPIMAFGLAHQILYNRQLTKQLNYTVQSKRKVDPDEFATLPKTEVARMVAAAKEAVTKSKVEEQLWKLPA